MDNKKYLLTSSALLILNFVLKILFIGSNSIAGDEPFTIYHAQVAVPSIIEFLKNYNNPPLFEIILHFWMKIFGTGALSVRFLPLLFSTATVFFIFRIGYKFFNYRVALTAALLFSFSNFQILFAHESRVYALFALFTSMSMYFFFEIIQHSKKGKYFVWLLITNALLLYAHYFGAFIIFIQFMSVLSISSLRKQFLKTYLLISAGVALLYIPQLHTLISRFSFAAGKGTWLPPPSGLDELYNMVWRFSNKPVTTIVCVLVLLSALVKLLIRKDYRNKSANSLTAIVVTWYLFPLLFMFFISFRIPMFLDRYLIFVSIGYYLTLAVAVNYVSGDNRTIQFLFPSFLVLFFVITFNPAMDNKRHVKETVSKIMELKDERSSVFICPFDFLTSFAYYYDQNIFTDVSDSTEYDKMISALNRQNIYPVYSMNPEYLHTDKILYLDAAADFTLPNNNILKTLNRDYKLSNVYRFPAGLYVYEFVRNS